MGGKKGRLITQGMDMKSRNVFVSHVQEDESHIERLYDLLKRSGLECRDSSVTSATPNNAEDERYIKYEIIAPQISWAGIVVVLITPQTLSSEWVNWEIEHANSLGKRIVGIWVHGNEGCDLPDALTKYADSVVGWNSERIIAAINGEDSWECPDSSSMETRDIKRIKCQ